MQTAAAGYALALADAPDSEVIAIRAYRQGLAAGDYDLVRRAIPVLERAKVAPPDTAIFRLADALRVRDAAQANVALDEIGKGPLDFIVPTMRAWLAQDAGQDAFAVLDSAQGNSLARRYAAEHRALLLIANGRMDEAVTALKLLLSSGQGDLDLRMGAAMAFASKGRKDLSASILTGDDPALADLRRRAARDTRLDASFGASRLLIRLAIDLAGEETQPLSVVLTRSALLLDPQDDRSRLLLADALSRDKAIERATATLAAIAPDGGYGRASREALVSILSEAGDPQAALKRAQALAHDEAATAADAQAYGDLLVKQGDYAGAADAYARAMSVGSDKPDWVLNLQRGGALEQAGRWEEARPFLQKAVELAPDQAVALNYLGYAQVERGENVEAALKLLERAKSLKPDDASITDSLGWAYFKRGQFARALPLLESAAQSEPADVTINEHLGDAYWQLGRRYEARYAWAAAAVYASGKDAARLAAKQSDGLTIVTATR